MTMCSGNLLQMLEKDDIITSKNSLIDSPFYHSKGQQVSLRFGFVHTDISFRLFLKFFVVLLPLTITFETKTRVKNKMAGLKHHWL